MACTHFFPRSGYLELDGLSPLVRRNASAQPRDNFYESRAPSSVINLMPYQILVDRVMHDYAQATVGSTCQPGQTFSEPTVKLYCG
jgi:hypothetical protein